MIASLDFGQGSCHEAWQNRQCLSTLSYFLATLVWQSLANPTVFERTSRLSGKVRFAKLGNYGGSPYLIFSICYHSTQALICFTLLPDTLATLTELLSPVHLLHITAHLSMSMGPAISYGLHIIEANKKAIRRIHHMNDGNYCTHQRNPKHFLHARNCHESEQTTDAHASSWKDVRETRPFVKSSNDQYLILSHHRRSVSLD